MANVSSFQVTLVAILLMVARHYRLPFTDNEITAVVAGVLGLGSTLWSIYQGYKTGTHSLGGFRRT